MRRREAETRRGSRALAFVPTLIEPDGSEAVRPWIEVRDGIGNVDNGSASEALSCVLLQGLNGCGYVQPLESLFRAIERTQDPTAPEYGFFGPGSLPAIVILTDRLDCSFEPEHEEAIFSSEGPKAFWSSDEPSSAICWNAGVACDPGWNCDPASLDALGSPVAPEQGVMRPVERYAQALTDLEAVTGEQALLTAIVGTGLDGSVVYGPAQDPDVEVQYGVGLACGAPFFDGAVPTVRIRELVEAEGGTLSSVCADSYAPAMQALASEVIQRMAGG